MENNHLLCSVGQEFGQCTAGPAWLCFEMSGASDGRIESLGLESPAGSFIPVSGGWWWLWTETLAVDVGWNLYMWLLPVTWLPPKNDGWISKVSIPRESQWKLYGLLCPSLGNHSVTSTVLYLLRKLVSERGTQTSPLEGGVSVSHWRKNMWNGYVLVHLLKKTTFYRHGDDN